MQRAATAFPRTVVVITVCPTASVPNSWRRKQRLVLAAARRIDALTAVPKDCAAHGAETLVVATDVGIESDCQRLLTAAAQRFGGIDVLVDSAGVSGHALLADVTDFGWYQDMMRINFFGALCCTHQALPLLNASRGLLVGVSSLAGKVGVPGSTAQSPSKFAMAGFFEALRTELTGTRVDVTMIFPGVSGFDKWEAIPVDVCARQIVEAMPDAGANS